LFIPEEIVVVAAAACSISLLITTVYIDIASSSSESRKFPLSMGGRDEEDGDARLDFCCFLFLFDRRVRGDEARILCLPLLCLDVSTVVVSAGGVAVPAATEAALVLTKLVSPGGAGGAVVSIAASPGGGVFF